MNDQMLARTASRAEGFADGSVRLSEDFQRTLAAGETAVAAGKAALDAGRQFWATVQPLLAWLAAWLEDDGARVVVAPAHRDAPRRAVSR